MAQILISINHSEGRMCSAPGAGDILRWRNFSFSCFQPPLEMTPISDPLGITIGLIRSPGGPTSARYSKKKKLKIKFWNGVVTWSPITAGWPCLGAVTDAHGSDFPRRVFTKIHISGATRSALVCCLQMTAGPTMGARSVLRMGTEPLFRNTVIGVERAVAATAVGKCISACSGRKYYSFEMPACDNKHQSTFIHPLSKPDYPKDPHGC